MKLLILCAIVALCAARKNISDEHKAKFKAFNAEHKLQFESSEIHDDHQETFSNNLDFIQNHDGKHFKVGLNKYSHLSDAQISQMNGYKGSRKPGAPRNQAPVESRRKRAVAAAPVDWIAKGAVTPVKDQGQCGSCWTFSATGGLEAAVFRKTGKLPSLSESYLLDCARGNYGNGCNGGDENSAFDYIIKSKGIPSEAAYPYRAVQQTCKSTVAKNATMTSYTYVNSNEADVAAALDKYGPLTIAIYVSGKAFTLYKSGVYYNPTCKSAYNDLNHAVLLVGYGTLNGVDYWLVKNSWGTTWGDNGYIKMARNKNNNCGIVTEVSYAVV